MLLVRSLFGGELMDKQTLEVPDETVAPTINDVASLSNVSENGIAVGQASHKIYGAS